MTLLEKYYAYVSGQCKDVFKDEAIVFDILADLIGRKGFRQEFDEVDDGIKNEMIETWLYIIQNHT